MKQLRRRRPCIGDSGIQTWIGSQLLYKLRAGEGRVLVICGGGTRGTQKGDRERQEGEKHACNLYGGEPEALATLRELGPRVTNGELTAFAAAEMYPSELASRLRDQPEAAEDRGPRLGGHCGSAEGFKGGKWVRYTYGFTGAPPGGTGGRGGVPLAIAVEMLLEGQITRKGVVAPEGCIDPVPFFERHSAYWTAPPEEGMILSQVVEEID